MNDIDDLAKLIRNDLNLLNDDQTLTRIIQFSIWVLHYMDSIQLHCVYFTNIRHCDRQKRKKSTFFFLLGICYRIIPFIFFDI